MKFVHFCAGLDHWNGMANTARQFVARETVEGHDSQLTSRLEDICAGVEQVVIHGAWLPAVHRAAKRAKAVGARLVIRPAGSYDPVRLRYHAWKKRICAFWERQMLRQADVVWATCKEEAQWIRDYCGGVKVEEIDLKAFFKIPEAVPPVRCEGGRPLRVLYLGRKHPLKGIAYLERAVAELQGQGASVELKIVSDAFGDALEQVWQWADVLCLPTLSENFGRVVAEALERDKFVVTTDGAPVWVDLKPEQGVYLKGFRDGDDATRVELLRFGLKGLATGWFASA